jgi:hypothetical protein
MRNGTYRKTTATNYLLNGFADARVLVIRDLVKRCHEGVRIAARNPQQMNQFLGGQSLLITATIYRA